MRPREPDDDILFDYLDADFGVAIAYVISGWGMFEFQLDEAIWDLAGVEPEYGACLTAQFTTAVARFNALTSLARLTGKTESVIKKVNKFSVRALALGDKRNRIAHDPCFTAYTSKKQYRLQKTSRGRLEFDYKAINTEELKVLAESIANLTKDFREFFSESLASWAEYRDKNLPHSVTQSEK